jgi:hypothetical protein
MRRNLAKVVKLARPDGSLGQELALAARSKQARSRHEERVEN